MPSKLPLQVILIRHPEDADFLPFEDAMVRAFKGGKEAGGYLAAGEDLGVQFRVFSSKPEPGLAPEFLDGFCHSMVVVLVDRALLEKADDPLWNWIEDCWRHIDNSKGRHGILVIPYDERTGAAFCRKRSSLGSIQLPTVTSFGERAIRPAMLALRVVHESRLLLASQNGKFLRMFISHAKQDGLPLAQALKHQIQSVGWLKTFYDAEDLPDGSNWEKGLEHGVESSLIIMLRTDIYDSRSWCQKEVLWSDEFAIPAILVDARTALNFPSGILPFDRLPSVRIPDGNLMRILFLALREGLRFLYFMRLVEEMKDCGELPQAAELRVFSYAPSMAALLRASADLTRASGAAGADRIILYPDPPLRRGVFEAAGALVEKYAPGTRLLTPNTLAATTGVRS